MNVDVLLANISLVLEIVFSVFIIRSKSYRYYPLFSFYIFESVFTNPVMTFLYINLTPVHYLQVYIVEFTIDSLLQILVIVEISRIAFKPFLHLIPKYAATLIIFCFFFLMLLLSLVFFYPAEKDLLPYAIYFVLIRNIIANSRVAIFFSVLALSRILAISWRSRPMQIAISFGIYAIAFLIGAVIHTHQHTQAAYLRVDHAIACVYIFAIIYLLLSFSLPEPDQKIFTPEMQNSLLRLAQEIRKDES